ncbi:MAG TPA: diguanylate cyclase [Pyrinomonadaceae bacterium]|nr:diguanylate cyclase [Pyrinomonadaceae bacterium]
MTFRIDMSDYNRGARAYWCAVVAAGALVLAWGFGSCLYFGPAQWAQLVVLASLVVVSGVHPVRIPGTKASLTAGDCFIFLGAIFLGVPACVVLGATDAFTSALSTSRRATSWIAAPACMALTAFVAGRVFFFALAAGGVTREPLGIREPAALEHLALPLVLMALVQYVLNGALVATLGALKSKRSAWACWRDGFLWTSWTFFAGAIAAAVVYAAISRFGLLYVVLSVPVIAATFATYRTYFERVNEKTREAAELSRLHLATVEALATAIDAKDQTTHFHVRRVQIYCARVGELMGLTPSEIKALKAGALLHDVGKLAVPDHILNKPGKLTEAEFERMKIHTTVGAQILERVGFPYPVVPVVLYHHEQWDGRGYPEGLRGEEIPLTARILSVVDCFDSVREERPYRRGMTREEACSMLRRGAGAHFDPRVVELFLRRLEEFEGEITAQGLEHRGVTVEECEHRELLGEDSDRALRARPSQSSPHSSDAPDYLSQITNAHREVYALYEIARTFGSSLDIEDTASVLINKVCHVIPSDLCAVYLYDDEKGYATAAHVSGRHSELLRGRAVAPGEGVVGFVLANRRASYLLDPMLDFSDVELPAGCRFQSMVALPLTKDERVLGVLAVYSSEPRCYADDDLRLLDTVARLASDALANAMSHAEAESNALTDNLTGLPNARAMYMRFEEEASRARRSGKPFQVVMLDLDDFKQVNDTFGHRTGDRMLREVGRILQAQLREYDFLARYAGDEFVAIVQDLTNDQTNELRERIERAVARFSIHVRGDKHARVGISIGSASYGVHGETLDQLLISADEAMYSAKSTHKQLANSPDSSKPQLNTGDLATTAIN